MRIFKQSKFVNTIPFGAGFERIAMSSRQNPPNFTALFEHPLKLSNRLAESPGDFETGQKNFIPCKRIIVLNRDNGIVIAGDLFMVVGYFESGTVLAFC
jgi:hypothetical protein